MGPVIRSIALAVTLLSLELSFSPPAEAGVGDIACALKGLFGKPVAGKPAAGKPFAAAPAPAVHAIPAQAVEPGAELLREQLIRSSMSPAGLAGEHDRYISVYLEDLQGQTAARLPARVLSVDREKLMVEILDTESGRTVIRELTPAEEKTLRTSSNAFEALSGRPLPSLTQVENRYVSVVTASGPRLPARIERIVKDPAGGNEVFVLIRGTDGQRVVRKLTPEELQSMRTSETAQQSFGRVALPPPLPPAPVAKVGDTVPFRDPQTGDIVRGKVLGLERGTAQIEYHVGPRTLQAQAPAQALHRAELDLKSLAEGSRIGILSTEDGEIYPGRVSSVSPTTIVYEIRTGGKWFKRRFTLGRENSVELVSPDLVPEGYQFQRTQKLGDYVTGSGATARLNFESPRLQRVIRGSIREIGAETGVLPTSSPDTILAKRNQIIQAWLKAATQYTDKAKGAEYGAARAAAQDIGATIGAIADNGNAVCREASVIGQVVLSEYGIRSEIVSGNLLVDVKTGSMGRHAWLETPDGLVINSNWGVDGVYTREEYYKKFGIKPVELKRQSVAQPMAGPH